MVVASEMLRVPSVYMVRSFFATSPTTILERLSASRPRSTPSRCCETLGRAEADFGEPSNGHREPAGAQVLNVAHLQSPYEGEEAESQNLAVEVDSIPRERPK